MSKWISKLGLRATGGIAFSLVLCCSPSVCAAGAVSVDPLDLAAPQAAKSAQKPLRAMARAGQRLVAVGIRGRIIFSDDGGKSWQQASVPVSSDLNAVTFADAMHGWAVGHDGVILHSSDGGRVWSLQLNGRQLEPLITDYYARTGREGNTDAAQVLENVRNLMQPSAASFFMGVAFEDAQRGIAVGKFGLILATQDGGKSWQPWIEHIDNPEFLHLSAIRRVAGTSWIVGEQGSVWRLDVARQRFELFQVGYKGVLFGIAGNHDFMLAFGLRGSAFRSADGGKSWANVATGLAGGISDAALLPGAKLVLATQSGQLAVSNDAGHTFRPFAARQPTMFSGVLALSAETLALVGLNGVHIQQSQ